MKEKLIKEIEFCKKILDSKLVCTEMILDGYVVNRKTFETIREADELELECFYTIRINEMKLRLLDESLPR
jgi:hypothetical protein